MRTHWNHRIRDLLVALAVIVIGAALLDVKKAGPSSSTRAVSSKTPALRVRNAYSNLPLSFEENRGQTDARVKFLARGGGYSLFLTSTEAVLEAARVIQRRKRQGSSEKW